jgi:hypothetical protein
MRWQFGAGRHGAMSPSRAALSAPTPPDLTATQEHTMDTDDATFGQADRPERADLPDGGARTDRTGTPSESADTALHDGQALDLGRVRQVRIRIPSGTVDVIGRDEVGARIEVHEGSKRPLPVRLADGVLRIGSTAAESGGRASVTVTVQRDAELEIDGTSASILVSGMKRGFGIRTVSGDVVCDATAGRARLEGVSGELALREHEGRVTVSTVSGPATASGLITRFDCSGVSGDLFLDLEAPERVDVRTVSGDVVMRLGPDRPADYTINTISGALHLDGADVGRLSGGYRGTWGRPGAEPTRVRVDGSSATVRIVHRDDT